MSQKKLTLPPATEADFLAGRAACIAYMKPTWKEQHEVTEMKPDDYAKSLKWKSTSHPNLTDAQLAAAAKRSAQLKK